MSLELTKWKTKPIPYMDDYRLAKVGFRQHPIDLEGDLLSEDLEDLLELGFAGENYYYKLDNPPYYQRIEHSIPELKARKSVASKLSEVNEQLKAFGLELYIFDAYRPVEVQNYFYDQWFPNYLKSVNPELEGEALRLEVEKYWAKGAQSNSEIDPLSPPPHSTGAAVDLTIRRVHSGEHLYMGSIFDDVTSVANCDFLEKESKLRALNFSETEALANRRLLHWLMVEQGFCCQPNEWWHFSYGDQLWARLLGKDFALYSFAGYTGKG